MGTTQPFIHVFLYSFVTEFLSEPNCGMTLLVDLLKDLHEEQQAKMSGTRRAKHDQMKRTLVG
jgi:hypothetical protein